MKAIILIDHGSRRPEAHQALLDLVKKFQEKTKTPLVIPAHMEIQKPTLLDAFEEAVRKGAQSVRVIPLFLFPGNHVETDIPRQCEEAHLKFPQVSWSLGRCLSESDQLIDVITDLETI